MKVLTALLQPVAPRTYADNFEYSTILDACSAILWHVSSYTKEFTVNLKEPYNARLTEQIFDGGFCVCFGTKGDSRNLSGAAVCYVCVLSVLLSPTLNSEGVPVKVLPEDEFWPKLPLIVSPYAFNSDMTP